MIDFEHLKKNPNLRVAFSDAARALAEVFQDDPAEFISNGKLVSFRTDGNALFIMRIEVKDYNETFNSTNQ